MDKQKDSLIEEALKGRHRDLQGSWYYIAAALAVGTAFTTSIQLTGVHHLPCFSVIFTGC